MKRVKLAAKKVNIRALLTLTDLVRLFKRSRVTILHWRQTDGLPAVRIRGEFMDTVRYNKDDVIAWAGKKGKRIHTRRVRRPHFSPARS